MRGRIWHKLPRLRGATLPAVNVMNPRKLFALGRFIPYGLSAFLDPLTPARALLLSLLLEASAPSSNGVNGVRNYLLCHFPSWLLLHFLREDAPFLVGACILLVAGLGWALWGNRPLWARLLSFGILGIPLLGLMMDMAGKDITQVQQLDPWGLASASNWEVTDTAGLSVQASLLPMDVPPNLLPPVLTNPSSSKRAQILLGLWALAVVATVFSLVWRRAAFGVLFLLPLGGGWLQAGDKQTIWYWGIDQAQEDLPRWWNLEFSQTPLPLEGDSGAILLHSSAGVWSWVRPCAEPTLPIDLVSWIEKNPLRPEVAGGAVELHPLLAWWARGERVEEGVRWGILANGDLVRRPISEVSSP